MPWNEKEVEAGEGSGAGDVYMELRNRRVRQRQQKRGQTRSEIMMPWNEEEEIMMLRNRRVTKGQFGKRKPKPKRKPKKFIPSKALLGEIERLAQKYTPKLSDGPDYWPDMITESNDIDSDSGSSRDDLPPPPLSSSRVTSCTPQVPVHSGSSCHAQSNIEIYAVMARLALEYYNFKEDTNLKLDLVTAASMDFDSVETVHINFLAYFDDPSEQCLLFAELINDCAMFEESDLSKCYVKGCCVIDKVDSGNPFGHHCDVCPFDKDSFHKVQHPGPLCGYRIISGDLFQGYSFWQYHPFAYEKPFRPKSKPMQSANSAAMYTICAKKALEHFNSNQQPVNAKVLFQFTKFKDVELKGGAHFLSIECGTTVHITFSSQENLFFAVLLIPLFQIERGWEDWKEDFVRVETCCRLEKIDSGNPFGRVCSLCSFHRVVGEVIHPSPRDGYCAADGNVSVDYDFMAVGSGIF